MIRILLTGLFCILFAPTVYGADQCGEAVSKVFTFCSSDQPDEAFGEAEAASPKDFQRVFDNFKKCAAAVGTCYQLCDNDTVGPGATAESLLRKLRNTYGNPPIISEIMECRDAFKVYADSVAASCEGYNIALRKITEPLTPNISELSDKCELFAKMEVASGAGSVAGQDDEEKKNEDRNQPSFGAKAVSGIAGGGGGPSVPPSGEIAGLPSGLSEMQLDRDAENKFVPTSGDALSPRDLARGLKPRPPVPKLPTDDGDQLPPSSLPDSRFAPTTGSFLNTGGIAGRSSERAQKVAQGQAALAPMANTNAPQAYYTVAAITPPTPAADDSGLGPAAQPKSQRPAKASNRGSRRTEKRQRPARAIPFGVIPPTLDNSEPGELLGPVAPMPVGTSIFDVTGDIFKRMRKEALVIENPEG